MFLKCFKNHDENTQKINFVINLVMLLIMGPVSYGFMGLTFNDATSSGIFFEMINNYYIH